MTRDEVLQNRYNLEGADLQGMDLRQMNLTNANLSGANLGMVDLSGATLWKADMRSANLTGADLSGAYLVAANFNNAQLLRANFYLANLSGSNLTEANLIGANLYQATLQNTKLNKAILPDFQIPQDRDIVGWKKLGDETTVIKLLIPKEAKRTACLINRKCRAEKAIVREMPEGEIRSFYNPEFIYELGKEVVADSYDDDIRTDCTHGIHFFLTKTEAMEW